jgi:branched-chain amino acid transport system substrate-binding protein
MDKYLQLKKAGAEAIILITSEMEGAAFVKEVAALLKSERLPILSHWSITGSDFPALTGPALYKIDHAVVQTFSFNAAKGETAPRVLAAARRLFNKQSSADIVSPVGLAHAYDLTHILAPAINLAGSSNRKAVRAALEKVTNYPGLIKFYRQPFTATRHEALDSGDVFMARYERNGSLVRIK